MDQLVRQLLNGSLVLILFFLNQTTFAQLKPNEKVTIAFIDTGLDFTHKDLSGKQFINKYEIPNNGIDDDANGFIDDVSGWNFVANSKNIYPNVPHGEHVACIASHIAPNVSILPLKIFTEDPNSNSILNEVRALTYLIKLQKSNQITHLIVNMSLSGQDYETIEPELLKQLDNANTILVFSAGNDGKNIDFKRNKTYPAAFKFHNSITVGNLDGDRPNRGSNYGYKSVDVFAQGTNVLSCLPKNMYGRMTGTSMSAPVVSGRAAQVWAEHMDWTSYQVKEYLLKHVDKLDNLRYISVTSGEIK